MPRLNTTSKAEATCSFPCRTSRARLGNCVRKVTPKNHSHEMPIRQRNTTRLSRASTRFRQVSVNGFQLIFSPGALAGESGTPCTAIRPMTAMATQHPPTSHGADVPTPTSRPPARLPSRMETKVPISTMPFPPVSSLAFRCCGR